jgi:SAM-dependent methyltransferase
MVATHSEHAANVRKLPVVRQTDDLDDAVDRLRADYDVTPYDSNSFPPSAPGQLAAVGYLFGLPSAEVSTARVLEIGCASGGNLLPFAAAHPQAQVVGIDLSPVQIDRARALADGLGLRNIEFLAADISRLDLAMLGRFDFVIAHGVYSWVPPEVQEALLAAFRALLAPDGVGYLSYNVYPGWKSKEIVRDVMKLASAADSTPQTKVQSAKDVVDFLEAVAPADGVMARVLAESRAFSEGFGDSYLLHDELETYNSPCYFQEMLARAGRHGLAFLAEARPEAMIPANFGPKVAEFVAAKCGGVQALTEQYLDFVANRMFRQSLLVHAERAPQINYSPGRSRYRRLHLAAWLPPVDEPTRIDYSRQEYLQADGAKLFTNDPGIKAGIDTITQRWPWTISREELVDTVSARLLAGGVTPSVNLADNIDNLLATLVLQGGASYRLEPLSPDPTHEPLHLPVTVRRMAELTGTEPEASVFNLWHETLTMSALDRHLFPLLDGTHDRAALIDALVAVNREIPLEIEDDGGRVSDEAELRAALDRYIDELPQHLSDLKLTRTY